MGLPPSPSCFTSPLPLDVPSLFKDPTKDPPMSEPPPLKEELAKPARFALRPMALKPLVGLRAAGDGGIVGGEWRPGHHAPPRPSVRVLFLAFRVRELL